MVEKLVLAQQLEEFFGSFYEQCNLSCHLRLQTLKRELESFEIPVPAKVENSLTLAKRSVERFSAWPLSVAENVREILEFIRPEAANIAISWFKRDLHPINLVVTDVDETLRSLRGTDNEIPENVLQAMRRLYRRFSQIQFVISTGQTLENVKGFITQSFGHEMFCSGRFVVVYEQGAGIFRQQGQRIDKIPLYAQLDNEIITLFDNVRAKLVDACFAELGWGCRQYHVSGNEFNIFLKPNHADGSEQAFQTCKAIARIVFKVLANALADRFNTPLAATLKGIKRYYLESNEPLRDVFEKQPSASTETDLPDQLKAMLDQIGVIYYPADGVGLYASGLDKATGLAEVLRLLLPLDNPSAVILGDGVVDLPMMAFSFDSTRKMLACPKGANPKVLQQVMLHDGIIYPQGEADVVFDAIYAFNLIQEMAQGLLVQNET